MDFIESIFSVTSGGLFGGIMGIFKQWLEIKTLEKNQSHELAMLNARTKSSIELASVEGSLRVDALEAGAFVESQKTGSNYAEVIKSSARIIILIVLFYMAYKIHGAVEAMVGGVGSLSHDEVLSIYHTMVYSVLFLLNMAVGWYYSQRTGKMFDAIMSGKYSERKSD